MEENRSYKELSGYKRKPWKAKPFDHKISKILEDEGYDVTDVRSQLNLGTKEEGVFRKRPFDVLTLVQVRQLSYMLPDFTIHEILTMIFAGNLHPKTRSAVKWFDDNFYDEKIHGKTGD